MPVVGLSWLLSTHVPTAAKVLAKMDIEGSEYDVRGHKKSVDLNSVDLNSADRAYLNRCLGLGLNSVDRAF